LNPIVLSLAVVTICTIVLLRDLQLGSAFQNGSTILKISLIVIIIVAGFLVRGSQPISFLPAKGDGALIISAPFAVSLYWVMYAYSGWNASTYIVGELRNPARTIPLSVGLGTILVMALYLATNAVFLRTTPMAELADKQQVAVIAGSHIFGGAGSKITALFICLGLISTVSGMMWIGPRITAAMGEDLRALKWLGRRNAHAVPTTAILVQFAIVILLLLTATFENAVRLVQFSLTLCSTLAVLGVFVLRWRRPDLPRPYRTWGYPVTPLIFLGISVWMLAHMLADASTRASSLKGLAIMALGLIVYFLSPKTKVAQPS
jgi:APA family basic amino acid/polyamine antiporter